MVELKLLPCPFCGGKAEPRATQFVGGPYVVEISCTVCFASSSMRPDTEEEAAAEWNRRTESNND